ncbi:MAG TPA: hypothetical protein VMN39_02330 [Longimicrobiaceae bacterium]|nr:hypothetical protein [Longimicrobiaceae bacterium]
MDLTRRFDPKGMRGWLTSLVCAFLMLGVVAAAVADLPEDHPRRDRDGRSLSPAAGNVLSRHQMDRNRVLMLLTQAGEIGATPGSVAGGGFWLAESNQYIFSSGLNVGAVLPNGTIVVAIGGPFSELHFGSLEFPEFPSISGLGHGVSSPGGLIWDSTINDGLEMPEQCTVDAFRVAQFPSLQPFDGEPFPGFADQTVCMAVNDLTAGTCSDCAGTRVGVEIVETLFAFGVPSVQDFVFVAFRVFNRTEFITAANTPAQPAGPYDLAQTIVAVAVDPDIGDASDDQIAFLPEVQTMVFWDVDFNEPSFQGIPGFGGITYLKTPVDPATGEEVGLQEFTVFTNGAPRPDPATKEVWYALMTGDVTEVVLEVDPRDVRGMASSGQFVLPVGGFVEVYGAYFFASVSGSPPGDLRAEAYKSLVTGALIPDANDDPAFDNFKIVQQTAQATFDAGFVVPTAPPKPDITLVPGDGQVTILWSGDPVDAVNPFAKVARDPFARLGTGERDPDAPGTGVFLEPGQIVYLGEFDQGGTTGFVTTDEAGIVGEEITNAAYNPNFVIQDFQGFRVYRSYTGLAADAELIAQFDLADAITGGVFCVAAQAVFTPEGDFVQNVCTEQQELAIGTNTGLGFAVIDRGGSFPDPSNGPGLINGIPVFYTVTSFAVNCGQSPVDIPAGTTVNPPPACLVLEGGLAPLRSATPRSDPSSLVDGSVGTAELVDGDGNVVEDEGDMPITAGVLTGPIPAARDWGLNVAIIQATAIPANFEVFVRIDSVSVSPGFGHPNSGCAAPPNLTSDNCFWGIPGFFDEVPAGDNRAWQVWMSVRDAEGNVLETPTGPAVAVALTDFVSFTGVTNFSGPEIQVLSPIDPDLGVAFTVRYSSSIGRRQQQCSLQGICVLTTPGGGGALPPSVAARRFSRGIYGQYTVADIEVTWSNQNGVLGFSSVRDISNNVDMPFLSGFGTGAWGFSLPTGLMPFEDEGASDPTVAGISARTDDGRVLFPDPWCSAITGGFPGDCTF